MKSCSRHLPGSVLSMGASDPRPPETLPVRAAPRHRRCVRNLCYTEARAPGGGRGPSPRELGSGNWGRSSQKVGRVADSGRAKEALEPVTHVRDQCPFLRRAGTVPAVGCYSERQQAGAVCGEQVGGDCELRPPSWVGAAGGQLGRELI